MTNYVPTSARFSRLILPVLILALFLNHIAQAEELTEIKPGMTRAEVIALWGNPPSQAQSGNTELLHYSHGREVFLENGRVQYVKKETSRSARQIPVPTAIEDRLQQWAIQQQAASVDFSSLEERDMTFGESVIFLAVFTSIMLLMLASMWRIFTKAGRPGWASLIPIYNAIVLIRVAGKPGWWVLLSMVPMVNVIIVIVVDISLAKQFGKSAAFGIGLFFLPLIFMPILAFGPAEHLNPV